MIDGLLKTPETYLFNSDRIEERCIILDSVNLAKKQWSDAFAVPFFSPLRSKTKIMMKAQTFCLSILCCFTCCLFSIGDDSAKRPNILLIMVDDMGIGDLACYGAPDTKSPRLDRLATEGLQFSAFRANSSVCSPSRAAMLAGVFCDRTGVQGVLRTEHETKNSWGWLRPELDTIGELLQKDGYHTALVGKWHVGMETPNHPNDRGFTLFKGFQCGMLDDYYTHLRCGVNPLRHNRESTTAQGHITDVFTDWACDFLRNQAKESAPFFLWLSYNAPHCPIHPAPQWVERVKRRDPSISDPRLSYLALIEHLDDAIGRVLDTLDSIGRADNTIVVFVSDNGGVPHFGGRIGDYRGQKGDMFDGGLLVPCLVRWPRRIAPQSRSDAKGTLMDLFPTFVEAANCRIKPRQDIDGVSLLPLLTGKAKTLPERELFFLRREGYNLYFGSTIEALISGDWKLVHNTPQVPLMLFNLKDDPYEKTDLVKQQKEEFARMRQALQEHIQRTGLTPWQPPKGHVLEPSWDK